MVVTVKLKYLRIAPRKVRMVANLIRGKKVKEAETLLKFLIKRPAESLRKLLNSAIATAEKDFHLAKSNLFISRLLVDEGPRLKRWRPRAKGKFYPFQRKSSHITLALDEIKKGGKEVKETGLKRKAIPKPVQTALKKRMK